MYTRVGNKVVYSHILRAEIKSRPIGILYIHTTFLIITVCAFVSDPFDYSLVLVKWQTIYYTYRLTHTHTWTKGSIKIKILKITTSATETKNNLFCNGSHSTNKKSLANIFWTYKNDVLGTAEATAAVM